MSATVVTRIVNHRGVPFHVRLVQKGDRYGLDNGLVHDAGEPLVEFWDASLENDPRFTLGLGQFVSRYYLGTLTGKDGWSTPRSAITHGLSLCGHWPEWTITAGNVVDAIAAVERAIASCQKPTLVSVP